jgi:hypothetical protein
VFFCSTLAWKNDRSSLLVKTKRKQKERSLTSLCFPTTFLCFQNDRLL